MKIVIAGGTGFLGAALTDALVRNSHEPVILTRNEGQTLITRRFEGLTPIRDEGQTPNPPRRVSWRPDGSVGPWAAEIDGAGAVVNLAGESIAGGRWTAARKQRILDSRVRATRSLAGAISRAAQPPPVFISGSAVGYYGPRGDEVVTEDTPPGDDFLARVCIQWEAEARAAASHTRVVYLRTGLVLDRDGGALPQMLPPFWFGAGGPVGSGRQYWPWIHRRDWVDVVRFAIRSTTLAGPLNACAPNPVTNAVFARALGKVLRRPAFMPAPAFALRLLLGEMADGLLLSGQRAVPHRAQAAGFAFTFNHLDEALAAIFRVS
jgi:hypothetical protein